MSPMSSSSGCPEGWRSSPRATWRSRRAAKGALMLRIDPEETNALLAEPHAQVIETLGRANRDGFASTPTASAPTPAPTSGAGASPTRDPYRQRLSEAQFSGVEASSAQRGPRTPSLRVPDPLAVSSEIFPVIARIAAAQVGGLAHLRAHQRHGDTFTAPLCRARPWTPSRPDRATPGRPRGTQPRLRSIRAQVRDRVPERAAIATKLRESSRIRRPRTRSRSRCKSATFPVGARG